MKTENSKKEEKEKNTTSKRNRYIEGKCGNKRKRVRERENEEKIEDVTETKRKTTTGK